MIQTGLKHILKHTVEQRETAKSFCSGALEVYATPSLICLMEECAFLSVEPLIMGEGSTTVGTAVNMRHLAPSKVGDLIVCESELIKIDGRALVFKITATNANGVLVGECEHERFIVNVQRFLEKLGS